MGDNTTYSEAVYFIYVTISTIGFGDFVIRFEDQNDYNRVVSNTRNYNRVVSNKIGQNFNDGLF